MHHVEGSAEESQLRAVVHMPLGGVMSASRNQRWRFALGIVVYSSLVACATTTAEVQSYDGVGNNVAAPTLGACGAGPG